MNVFVAFPFLLSYVYFKLSTWIVECVPCIFIFLLLFNTDVHSNHFSLKGIPILSFLFKVLI